MSKMLVKIFRENYDIIYVDLRILTMFSKKTIYLTLHVDERILIFHYRYVEEFLFFVTNDDETMTIIKMNASLIEERKAINHDDVLTF